MSIHTLKKRKVTTMSNEQDILHREAELTKREQALNLEENQVTANEAYNALSQAQLLEANQNLVIASIRAQMMMEAAEQANAQMSHMAEHDLLTGLPNRSLMAHRLEQSMTLAQRNNYQVALMFLDIDHFKNINDSLGHAIGDQLLQSVAKRLQSCVRLSDTVSRYGGDEFVILLSEVKDPEDAITIADKLISAMVTPHDIGGHSLHVTMSIGISLYPEDSQNVEALIRDADTAMYQAKRKGRNKYVKFTQDMNLRAVARQSIEQALHRALLNQEFVVHYQPKVNLETGQITGAEALIRWQRSENNLILPIDFINIAEECGIMLPIGNWVMREACRQMQDWLNAGLSIRQIAVNVSATEFHNKGFFDGVQAILEETGLAPHLLEIELTESGLMQDIETTAILYALKELGVHIAIDDFGTGYSSLSYLRNFPIDTLKVDQTFVKDIKTSTSETIVTAIIAMGRSLNHRVVAEGIETQEQLDFLKNCNCAEGQGYFFSEALPAPDFASLLERSAT